MTPKVGFQSTDARAAWVSLVLVLGTACEPRTPWSEALDWKDSRISAVSVFRTPDNRLCGFLDGRFNGNGTLQSPGAVTCDTGRLGEVGEVIAGSATSAGVLVPAPVTPAVYFAPTLSRFDPKTGAITTMAVSTSPPAAVDGQGRLIVQTAGRLERRETNGDSSPLYGGSLPGQLFIAPDDRLFIETTSGAARIVELAGQKLVPIISCPDEVLADGCLNAAVLGFDSVGSMYVAAIVPSRETQVFLRIASDRSVTRLPDGPKPARPGSRPQCAVTASGALVCMYPFNEFDSEEVRWSRHIELISLGAGARDWYRVGLAVAGDLSPFYIAARDGFDVIAGDFSGGASTHILNLMALHF